MYNDNENLYSDIKLLLYPERSNLLCNYLLCAHHLSFQREKKENGYYYLVQKAPINILCQAAQPWREKDINIEKCIPMSVFFKKIVATDNNPLLFTIKHKEYFFEVQCGGMSGQYSSPWELMPIGSISYMGHKFTEEEMRSHFREALSNVNVISYVESDVISIERMDTIEEINKMNSFKQECKIINNSSYFGPTTGMVTIYPNWSQNIQSEELICSISTREKTLLFEIRCDDFIPRYHGDRDGGWFVYTHEEKVIGQKHFQTIFAMQEYIMKYIKGIQHAFDDDEILVCKYPFSYKANLTFKTSVKELFFMLEIQNYNTIWATHKENVNFLEDDWIYGFSGATNGLWRTRNGLDPYPPDFLPF